MKIFLFFLPQSFIANSTREQDQIPLHFQFLPPLIDFTRAQFSIEENSSERIPEPYLQAAAVYQRIPDGW